MLDCVGLSRYFASVGDWGRTRRHKPHPDPLLAVLDDLGIAPNNSVWYVGDAESDALAAQSAGVSFAWAAYGYGDGAPPTAATQLSEFRDVASL
jgi:phosphoglycolate phosphatase